MWAWLASRILRNRIAVLVMVAVLTGWLGYQTKNVAMQYKHGGLLPETDSAFVDYERFLAQFSEDGNVLVIGTQGDSLYTPQAFSAGRKQVSSSAACLRFLGNVRQKEEFAFLMALVHLLALFCISTSNSSSSFAVFQ